MLKKILIIGFVILGGFLVSFGIVFSLQRVLVPTHQKVVVSKGEVIGFLPYWLIDKANKDYSNDITTLTYFGLRVDTDGSIVKLTDPQEEEPGWNNLQSGRMDSFITAAKKNHTKLSLLISAGDNDAINALMESPTQHAKNLMTDVEPIMQKYGFTDLNLDIEYDGDASRSAQKNFAQFVQGTKKELREKQYSLTVEISPTEIIKNGLINLQDIASSADAIVIMAYDYHATESFVTGPVAPLSGAGSESEYDVQTAVQKALQIIPPQKIILGVPLYGYEWETLGTKPRSAIIPGSGVTASDMRVESLLASCATCSAKFDTTAQESYIVYKDEDTGTYHQLFYPDEQSMTAKIHFAETNQLKGLALWALGYEGDTLLNPLVSYRYEK